MKTSHTPSPKKRRRKMRRVTEYHFCHDAPAGSDKVKRGIVGSRNMAGSQLLDLEGTIRRFLLARRRLLLALAHGKGKRGRRQETLWFDRLIKESSNLQGGIENIELEMIHVSKLELLALEP